MPVGQVLLSFRQIRRFLGCLLWWIWSTLTYREFYPSSAMGWAAKIHNSQTPLQLGFWRKIRFTQVHADAVWKVEARQGYFPAASAVAAGRHEPRSVGSVYSSVFCHSLTS